MIFTSILLLHYITEKGGHFKDFKKAGRTGYRGKRRTCPPKEDVWQP